LRRERNVRHCGSVADTAVNRSPHGPSAASGLLLLADISGYSAFLSAVALAHKDDAFADGAVPEAYAMMSSLLDGIVARLVPPFTLSKLEGDAVFAYATNPGPTLRGQAVLDCLTECHADFRGRLADARDVWPCWCEACARVDVLDLKFIVHAGPYVIQRIAGAHELVGPEVVLAHRLLKCGAGALVDNSAFALFTAPAASLLELPTGAAVPISETYEHYPTPIDGHIFPLRDARLGAT
jgi:hypothetical protein